MSLLVLGRVLYKAKMPKNGIRKFSKFENYSIRCNDYDKMRCPVGMDIVNEKLCTIESDYSKLKMLDVGCGTGNYIQSLCNLGIGSIYGIDANNEMLSKCSDKVVLAKNNIYLKQHNLITKDKLPFNDNMFDSIMINQVLHHLDDNNTRKADDGFQNICNVLTEIWRCLKDGGILFINQSSPAQCAFGIWYYQFIPNTSEIVFSMLPSKKWMQIQLNKICIGHKKIESYLVKESMFDMNTYYDLNGIFNKDWRNCASAFVFTDDDELKAAQKAINRIIQNKQYTKQFIHESEMKRQLIGQSTTYVIYK